MSTIYKNGTYYGKAGDPMPAEDMSEVLDPLPSVKSHGSWIELNGVLTAGSTSITFTSNAITDDCVIDIYTDADIPYVSRTISVGSLVITYDLQASDVAVKVRIS